MLGTKDDPYALQDRNSGFPAFVRSNAGNFGNFAGAGAFTEGTRELGGVESSGFRRWPHYLTERVQSLWKAEDDSACQWFVRGISFPGRALSVHWPIGRYHAANRWNRWCVALHGKMRSNFSHTEFPSRDFPRESRRSASFTKFYHFLISFSRLPGTKI